MDSCTIETGSMVSGAGGAGVVGLFLIAGGELSETPEKAHMFKSRLRAVGNGVKKCDKLSPIYRFSCLESRLLEVQSEHRFCLICPLLFPVRSSSFIVYV